MTQVLRRFQEAPSSKSQPPEKLQSANSKPTAVARECLRFGFWNFSGTWSLDFGAFSFHALWLLPFASTSCHCRPFAARHRFLRCDGHSGTNALQAVDHDH